MRKSITIFVCILLGYPFLMGCPLMSDFATGKYIGLIPMGTYVTPESNTALQNDFNEVTRIVENFAVERDFVKRVEVSKLLYQVYQKWDRGKMYTISISFSESNDLIVVAVTEGPSRKPSGRMEKVYIALQDQLQKEFNGRIRRLWEEKPQK